MWTVLSPPLQSHLPGLPVEENQQEGGDGEEAEDEENLALFYFDKEAEDAEKEAGAGLPGAPFQVASCC